MRAPALTWTQVPDASAFADLGAVVDDGGGVRAVRHVLPPRTPHADHACAGTGGSRQSALVASRLE